MVQLLTQPVKKGIEKKKERVEHDLVPAQLGSEVQHKDPVQAERYCDESNGQVRNLLRSRNNGNDHNEEQKRRSSNGVLSQTNDNEQGVPFPKPEIRQHTGFIGDETEKPPPPLLEKALESLNGFGLAESTRVHLDLVPFSSPDHEEMRQPAVLA